ncbi:MAG: Ig-like domain-containing protein [Chloroflexota bacterium]
MRTALYPRPPVSTATGRAACTVTYTSTGSHSIVVTHSGDTTFSGSTSSPLTQTVNPPPVDLTTTLTVAPNPVAPGGMVHIHAAVSNTGKVTEQVTLSVTITSPTGSVYRSQPSTVTIGPGKTISRDLTFRVPWQAPPGT